MTRSELAMALGTGLRLTRFTVSYKDLQAISGSGAKPVDLFTLPIDALVLGVRAKHSVAFAGGSLSAMTLLVGKTGTTNHFTAAYDIFAAVADTTLQETSLFKKAQKSALPVIATFTPTGDSVSLATAGSVDIDILWLDVTGGN